MNTPLRTVTEISEQMPRFYRPIAEGEKRVRLNWSTDSGTGSTLCYVVATNMVDAYAGARAHFARAFAPHGYTLESLASS